MAKAITFDVWETLITDRPDMMRARSEARVRRMVEVLRRSGQSVSEQELLRAYEASFEVYDRVWDSNQDIGSDEQVRVILDLIRPGLAAELDEPAWRDIVAAYVDPLFDYPPAPRDDVVACLRAARELGFRVGLICNTGRSPGWAVRELLAAIDVLEYFDVLAFSDEEQVRKPAPEIFQRVLNLLGVEPAEAVHIGDNIVADIGGAKGIGMKAVLIAESVPENAPVAPDAHVTELSEFIRLLPELSEAMAQEQ